MQSILTVAWLPTGSRGDPETPRVGRPSTCSINLNLFAKVHMRNFCFCIPEMLRCACPSVCTSLCVCVRSGTVSECQIFTSGMQRLRAQGEPWLRVRPTTSVKFLFLFFPSLIFHATVQHLCQEWHKVRMARLACWILRIRIKHIFVYLFFKYFSAELLEYTFCQCIIAPLFYQLHIFGIFSIVIF